MNDPEPLVKAELDAAYECIKAAAPYIPSERMRAWRKARTARQTAQWHIEGVGYDPVLPGEEWHH